MHHKASQEAIPYKRPDSCSRALIGVRGFELPNSPVFNRLWGGFYRPVERPYHYQSDDTVELTSIGGRFPFDAVYRRIPL